MKTNEVVTGYRSHLLAITNESFFFLFFFFCFLFGCNATILSLAFAVIICGYKTFLFVCLITFIVFISISFLPVFVYFTSALLSLLGECF